MPSRRPCAAFEPISPDFNVKQLVENTPNFDYAARIHLDMVEFRGVEEFERLVRLHVINGGKPLVIEGYENRLDRWTFALQWLRDNCASKVEHARDLSKKSNVPLSIGHYLNHMALLTDQWNENNYKDAERQRMYLKDIDCPQLWQDKLQDIIPLNVFYLNESIGEFGGLGSLEEADPSGTGTRKSRGAAKSGDLMSNLAPDMRAQNLMCYIGHEGTYTPAHKEMCASLGQNIMVETSTGSVEDGKPTKPGSSLWFMTETKEKDIVSEYWLSKLGHDVEVENHFAQINAWRAAPFKTWVVEQRVGDLILVPPLAPHQVWNRGTRTMKVAWNRTTVETLELALHVALPAARMVCRDEQYKCKAIIYYTMQRYSKMLKVADKQKQKQPKHRNISDGYVRQLRKDFRKLQTLFTEIMVSESFYPTQTMPNPKVELVPFDSNITCSYCRCNIFNRFLTCPSCIGDLGDGGEDTYDICMDCYAMGRSCACISKLRWVEQFPWGELTQKHEQWRHLILQTEGQVTDTSPKSLRTELEKLGKKRTLAQICQTGLSNRPFNDITKEKTKADLRKSTLADEVQVDDNGNVKKPKKPRRSEKFTREHARCHVDCHWEPKWKQADCSTCDKKFCFGLLFRAYDMMPQDILADPDWRCPSCRNFCGCRNCNTKPGFKPYSPSGTMLGHNTKAIADPRSVESLVDFGASNISWIQKAGDDNEDDTRRMKRRKIAAEKAKAQAPDIDDMDLTRDDGQLDDGVEDNILLLAQQEGIPIDPALAAMSGAVFAKGDGNGSNESEDEFDENPEGAKGSEEYALGGPPPPQYIIPAGGVIRTFEHAYDNIEAITYDYPDPEVGQHLSLPVEEEPIDSGVASGYGPAVSVPDTEISMIHNRRKRKLDEGEKSFQYHKSQKLNSDRSKKPRRSLIVKFNIDKTKLAQVYSRASIAQQALNGLAAIEAPVVSSDLRALNVDGQAIDGQPPKKTRLEEIDSEEDDEFTPGRWRDRRKSAMDGVPRPNADADITRRQTRMQATTYEEPSDDDIFDEEIEETVPERRPEHVISKLATMELAEKQLDSNSESVSKASSAATPTAENPTIVCLDDGSSSLADNSAPNVVTNQLAPFTNGVSTPAQEKPSPAVLLIAKGKSSSPVVDNNLDKALNKILHTAPAQESKEPSKAELEAIANRKAKLAAFEEIDTEDASDDVSEVSSPPKQQQEQAEVKNRSIPIEIEIPIPIPKPSTATAARVVVSKKDAKASSLPKASAADWGNSSSDDDTYQKPVRTTSGWAAVNKASPASTLKPAGQRSRGRPPRSSLYAGQRS